MKNTEKTTFESAVRDGRFEFLRIVAMPLIILQHPLERSVEDDLPGLMTEPLSVNWIFASAVSIWGTAWRYAVCDDQFLVHVRTAGD